MAHTDHSGNAGPSGNTGHGGHTGHNGPGIARTVERGTRTLSVAAVDPVPIFREGLHTVIDHTPGLRWAGHAASHHAAIQLCEQARPDVVLLDAAFDPRCHLTTMLTESHPALVVVVLVGPEQRTPLHLATALAAGAHGLLPRAAEPRRLTDGIRRTYVERGHTDPALAPLLDTPGTGPGVGGGPPQTPLSRREYQVLHLIAEGMENSAVAESLFLSVETVRTHVKSILRKMSAHDRTHAVTKAFREGLLVLGPEEPAHPARSTPEQQAREQPPHPQPS
ncbi:response regulator transcription factor [Saccharomonospora halophila]|uniref:response regulator transcription factor n=1 Tax=Saccharomonospora halophila TaxID=129922 RepID=UPI000382E43D|nr:response regulator transcription factor [Saccharomonospora halophila]